jgi:hypothetical protein
MRVGVPEARELLASPFAMEDLAGPEPFVVDLDGSIDSIDTSDLDASVLRDLDCVTIAVVDGPPPAAACDFDVVVDDSEVDDVVDAVTNHPHASLALVQLLRPESSLVAESMAYSMLQSGPEFAAWLATRAPARPARADHGDPVIVRRNASTIRLTLNRPHVHNAFNTAMRDALVEALRAADADASVAAIEVTGTGPSFCSGGDLDEFGTYPDPVTAHAVRSRRSPAWWMARCGRRTTALVHGACVGAGAELAAFAERVVARDDAFFMLPEVSLGLVPGAGGTVSLPRRIGRQRTALLALTGRRIDAGTAMSWGLVDDVS